MSECRQMIDVTRDACHVATTAERHALAALGLQQDTHALLGIGGTEHSHITLAVMVIVIERRILSLLGIFSKDAESLERQVQTSVPCVDKFRQIEFVCRVHKDGIVIGILMLVDP